MYFAIYHPVIGFEVASRYAGMWTTTSRPILGAPYKVSENFTTPDEAREWITKAMESEPFAMGQLQLAFLPDDKTNEEAT